MKYDIVLFDLDDTLFDSASSFQRSYYFTVAPLGILAEKIPYSEYVRINEIWWSRFQSGEITVGEARRYRFHQLFEEHNIAADPDKYAADYLEYMNSAADLCTGALEICEKLHSAGANLYIASNGTVSIQKRRMGLSGLDRYFSGIFASDILGFRKPAPEFFNELFLKIGSPDKSRVLMVGDDSPDILGGNAFGIDTCLYLPINKTLDYAASYTIKHLLELENIVI